MLPPKTKTKTVYTTIPTLITCRTPQGALAWKNEFKTVYTLSKSTIWNTRFPPPLFNDCSHSRTLGSIGVIGDTWKDASGSSYYANGIIGSFAAPPKVISEVDWGGALAAILDDAWGVVPSNESFLVNLAELSELKNLAPNLLQGIASLPKLYRSTKFKLMTLRDLAGTHLAVEFGLLPLMSDLVAFLNLASGVAQKLQWMQQIERQKSYPFRAKTKVVSSVVNETYTSCPASGLQGSHMEVNRKGSSVCTTQGTLAIKGEVELHHPAVQEIRGWLSSVGLTNPLAVVWELIPFSFVIDWFLPIGESLSRTSLPRALGSMASAVNFHDPSFSIKSTCIRTYTSRYELLSGQGFTGGTKPTPLITYQYTDYSRQRGWPLMETLPSSTDWTFRRSAIAGSLVVVTKGKSNGGGR